MSQRELARAGETSQAAVDRYEAGRVLPDLRTLDRLLGVCGQRLSVEAVPARRTGRESATTRPVAIPDDFADGDEAKAVGLVELPPHIRWSGPPRSYDLGQRRDRARVYEQVLREGTEDDVRHFVRVDELVELWDELVLPDYVRAAWDRWSRLGRKRSGAEHISGACRSNGRRPSRGPGVRPRWWGPWWSTASPSGPPNDLDFFTPAPTDVPVLRQALETAFGEAGLTVAIVKDTETFVRLAVGDGMTDTLVDLAWDARMRSVAAEP